MGRCGCSSDCLCTVTGGDCVVVAGNGSLATPYTISAEVDPDVTNRLVCNPDGLYVAELVFGDTTCIDISGTGTSVDPIVASPVVDPDPANILACGEDGLFVPANETGGVPVWTTAERPDPGTTGYVYYDTTIPGLMVKSGATVGYTPPWNLPWGQVAYAETIVNTTAIGATYKDLTGLSVTWTAVANRRYKVTGFADIVSDAIAQCRVAIADGSNVTQAQSHLASGDADNVQTHTPMQVFTAGASGATTRKLRGLVTVGTGATQSNTFGPHFILVEDVGPGGAPS